MIKNAILLFAIVFGLDVLGQNRNQIIMTSFVPKSKAYDVYYPKNFQLNEDNEGNVSIYDSISKLNITLSSYPVGKGMDDKKLIGQLNGFVKGYFNNEMREEDWNSYKTKFEILVESKFSVKQTNWVWYGIVDKQRLVTISINKDTVITEDEVNLVKYMINNLIIN